MAVGQAVIRNHSLTNQNSAFIMFTRNANKNTIYRNLGEGLFQLSQIVKFAEG